MISFKGIHRIVSQPELSARHGLKVFRPLLLTVVHFVGYLLRLIFKKHVLLLLQYLLYFRFRFIFNAHFQEFSNDAALYSHRYKNFIGLLVVFSGKQYLKQT
jgi:hypothetical protein